MKIFTSGNNTIIKIFLILLFFTELSFSQNKYDFNNFIDESVDFTLEPCNWDGEDWIKLSSLGISTLGAMHFDENIRGYLRDNDDYQYSLPVEIGRLYGEPLTSLLLSAGFYIHGNSNNITSNRKLGYEIGQSFLYTGVVTLFTKYAFGRARPYNDKGSTIYNPFSFRGNDFMSLISGHTSLAFSLSTVISKNLDQDIWRYSVYLPAVLTAFSRVYQDHHWFSDVAAGALTGYFIAEYVSKIHKPAMDNSEKKSPTPLFSISLPL
jgi:hypothetical protein